MIHDASGQLGGHSGCGRRRIPIDVRVLDHFPRRMDQGKREATVPSHGQPCVLPEVRTQHLRLVERAVIDGRGLR
jgi:hypothetical protein